MILARLVRALSGHAQITISWVMLLGCLVMWPIAATTWARDEPQFVLGLSFLALIYEAFNAIQISHDVKSRREGGST